MPKVGAGDTAPVSRWWLVHYPDRDSLEVACCCHNATDADILERHPVAGAGELRERWPGLVQKGGAR